jgi:hypothetical protein
MYDPDLLSKVYEARKAFEKAQNGLSDKFSSEDFVPLLKSTGYMPKNEHLIPEQTKEFQAILDSLLEMHKKKTADYSSWNIKGAGEQGVAVRLWDKTARLMNLMGWDIGTGKWSQPKEPKNESVDDTLMDLASYAIIMIILRRGKWGK